jgi:ABC-type proline/glycine betaine transport system substrate-binding protein
VSNFSKVLDSFYITLKVEDAWASMQDDQKTNHELVTEWVGIAKFK